HSMIEEWSYLTNTLLVTFFPGVGVKEPHRNPFYNSNFIIIYLFSWSDRTIVVSPKIADTNSAMQMTQTSICVICRIDHASTSSVYIKLEQLYVQPFYAQ